MDTYVIVGAGPVGTETAQLLRDRADRVVVVSRSGSGPVIDGIEPITADASDADALAEITDGATALFNCANPRNYTQWAAVWPPLAGSLLSAAERTGATLVTASSLYGYGPVDGPMLEGMPDAATDKKGKIRAGIWAEAKARHDAGRLRAVEVRASDYVGARVGANGHITRHLPTAKHGKAAWVIGDPDLPHSWTDVRDVGRTLVAVATQADTWGQVWHAPSNPARSQRAALTDVLAAAGKPPVAVRAIPRAIMALGGAVSPLVRELNDMAYIFRRPYVVSAQQTQDHLGLAPTPWAEVCRRTAEGN